MVDSGWDENRMLKLVVTRRLNQWLVAVWIYLVYSAQLSNCFEERTWYVSPEGEATDPAVCGRTPSSPCHGLREVLEYACRPAPGQYTVQLLPGLYTVQVNYSTVISLRNCQNLVIQAFNQSDLYPVELHTICYQTDPIPENYNFSAADILEEDCNLDSLRHGFGVAAFAFNNPKGLRLQNLVFSTSQCSNGSILMLSNGSNVIIDRCQFADLPPSQRALTIINPRGMIRVLRSEFTNTESYSLTTHTSWRNDHALVYVLTGAANESLTYTTEVFFSGCIFRQSCPYSNVRDRWVVRLSWKIYQFLHDGAYACDNVLMGRMIEAHSLRVDIDGGTSNVNVIVYNTSFISTSREQQCLSILGAMSVLVSCAAKNNFVWVYKSNFTNFVAFQGSAIRVILTGESGNNKILLQNLLLQSNGLLNTTREGGAIFVLSEANADLNNKVKLENIIVRHCQAALGSAVYFHRIQTFDSKCFGCFGLIRDSQCEKMVSRIFQTFSYLTSISEKPFQNRAFSLLGSQILDNEAVQGAIYTNHISLILSGAFTRSKFISNRGGALYVRDTNIFMTGEVLFLHNSAVNGGAIACYSHSKVFATVGKLNAAFIGNTASARGGAIFVDASSSSATFDDMLLFGKRVMQSLGCPLEFLPLMPGNTSNSEEMPLVTFTQNTACIQGHDVFAESLVRCSPFTGDAFKTNKLENNSQPGEFNSSRQCSGSSQPVATGPNLLVLRGTDSQCVKRARDTYWLINNCSNDLTQLLFSRIPSLTKAAQTYKSQIPQFIAPEILSIGKAPTDSDLLMPWVETAISPEYITDLYTTITHNPYTHIPQDLNLELEPSNIVLLPAPGEEFSLDIASLDELLSPVTTNAYIQVNSSTGDKVHALLRENGRFQLANGDKIFFVPNRLMIGLSLVGRPGTRGTLQVVVQSGVDSQLLTLNIPFQLAPCPLGFAMTPDRLVKFGSGMELNSTATMTKWRTGLIPASWQDGKDPIACNCQKNAAVGSCKSGRSVVTQPHYWVGSLHSPSTANRLNSMSCPQQLIPPYFTDKIDLLCFPVNQTPNVYDALVAINNGTEFVYGALVRDFGSQTVSRQGETFSLSITQSSKALSLVSCRTHRTGPLCGQCEKGYAVTPYYLKCVDCSGATITGVVVTMVLLGVALFTVAIIFTWGVTPTLVSLLFFAQGTALVVNDIDTSLPHGQEYISRTLSLDWSFGMCLGEDLDALSRLLWAYATPSYLLSLLFISYLLSHLKWLMKVFARRNCIRMFWLVILLSYGSLSITSFRLLKCVELSPTNAVLKVSSSATRLADDASVECYHGNHLPAAIVAIFVVITICIPAPIALPFLHRWPRFKPFSDVYNSLYKDDRRWWSGVDLVRRLLLAAVYTAEVDSEKQHLATLICCMLLLTIHTIMWPFKKWLENVVETLFLTALSCIAALTGPNNSWSRAFAIQWLFFVPLAIVLITSIAQLLPNAKRWTSDNFGVKFNSLKGQNLSTQSLQEASNEGRLQLRDPLLADESTHL